MVYDYEKCKQYRAKIKGGGLRLRRQKIILKLAQKIMGNKGIIKAELKASDEILKNIRKNIERYDQCIGIIAERYNLL